jgi:hypothetical protein
MKHFYLIGYFKFLILLLPCFNTFADEKLLANEGYVVINIIVKDALPQSVKIKSSNFLGENYTKSDLKVGENFELIKLPEGEYYWSRLNLKNGRYFDLEDNNFTLKVIAGKINYSGHLLVDVNSKFSTGSFDYVNRSSVVIEQLESCCSELLNFITLIYTGRSVDPFIEFFQRISNEKGG